MAIAYAVGAWDYETLGNHRVVLAVTQVQSAVRAVIPWRRRDAQPEQKRLLIFSESGAAVRNIARLEITRETADLVFEPVAGPGVYYLYPQAYTGTTQAPYPQIEYLGPEEPPDPAWQAGWQAHAATLPQAEVRSIQAIDALHSFYPMEVIATQAETAELRAQAGPRPFALFPEDRQFPIRMTEDLPQRWAERGLNPAFAGAACRGEFYAFQIGVWAFCQPLHRLTVEFSDLVQAQSAAVIPAGAFRCFNLGGLDWTGAAFEKELNLAEQQIQALWCGVQLPADAEPGCYRAEIRVCAAGGLAQPLHFELEVGADVLPAAGEDEPWRHSRLRWLDSTLALDDEVTRPFIPVTVQGRELQILGRRIWLDRCGLPEQITSYFTPEMTGIDTLGREILNQPLQLIVDDAQGRPLEWHTAPYAVTQTAPGVCAWQTVWTSADLQVQLRATLEFDGTLEYTLALSALRDCSVQDIRLEIPYRAEAARYMLGLGVVGGLRPSEIHWKWDVDRKNQDSAWLGDVNAGLQFTLKDEQYARPLNTNYYLLKPLRRPDSWDNQGQGGIEIAQEGDCVRVKCVSGARSLAPGRVLHFNFRLAVTPFKPLDTEAQWATRFYHRYQALDEIRQEGANTVNIHHATPINPYINYPFLTPVEMQAYLAEAHRKDLRVKLYYTVRELTNHAPEIYALRSLGFEILSDGPGGGHSWLQEHLVNHYIPGWHVFPLRDVAVINSGTSRWHNFYLEGLDWLARNIGIDGVYIDDLAFDRVVMKRVRKILDRHRPDALIDLHSANQFRDRDGFANSANLYLEHFPYLNRLWFGEYFDYNLPPDFWLVEVSGIPFGLMGEMLQDGGNPWRGMLYGMTARLPFAGDPRPVWRIWQEFGMAGACMLGYWSPNCPVRTNHPQVLATAYVKPEQTLISLASWAPETVRVQLTLDWEKLGLDPQRSSLRAPGSPGFQPEQLFAPQDWIEVVPGQGWLLILTEKE